MTAEVVAEYLRDNPSFFDTRRHLIDSLSLSHQEQGAVSLVQVQLTRQRQRIEELEEEITTLMSMAQRNDKTFQEFMGLQERLLNCDSLLSAIQAVEETAKSLGLLAYVRLFECDSSYYSLNRADYQRFATTHLNGKQAYLGRMRKSDRQRLFGAKNRAPEMGSYVVLPIKKKALLGMLAFSSADGGHFQPDMDTLFLRHLVLVFAQLVEILPWQCQEHERISNTTA
nr:DUF484 family protein [Vibrio ostreicida]